MSIFCVDNNLCTRCGACSGVCPQGIIDPAEKPAFPIVPNEKSPLCIMCGQCVAACPTGAASLSIDQGAGYKPVIDEHAIDPEVLGTYIRSRRSVRKYRPEPVDRETITKILDVARWAASGGNGQPVEWLVIHDPAKVKEVARLTIDWMKSLAGTEHPMAAFAPLLVSA
jgi:ferredoxin